MGSMPNSRWRLLSREGLFVDQNVNQMDPCKRKNQKLDNMTLIKTEPIIDSKVIISSSKDASSDKSKETPRRRPNTTTDSRPALSSKRINVISGKKESAKDLQKHKFEDFLLSPVRIVQSSSDLKKDYILGFQQETPLIKKEVEQTKEVFPENSSNPAKRKSGDVTTALEAGMYSTKKKKLNTSEKLKEALSTNGHGGGKSGNARQQSENPGSYVPIEKLLYESNSESGDKVNVERSLFQDIEQETERIFCEQVSSWSLSRWINEGQVLLNTHTNLIGQLIRQRIELSCKFQAITSVINERAAALHVQGEILDEKLKKIEHLGKEILDII